MDSSDNAYEILGISKNATNTEIKKAYRSMALKFHPDRQSTDEDRERCQHVFARLSHAYEILSDSDERERYDRNLKEKAAKPVAKTKSSFPQPKSPKKAASSPTAPSPSTPTPSKKSSSATSSPKKQKSPKKKPATRTVAKPGQPKVEKSWQERVDQGASTDWNFAVGKPASDNQLAIEAGFYNYKPVKGFHDPYETFKKVFKEEFNEDFNPNAPSKAARNRSNPGGQQLEVYKGSNNSSLVKADRNQKKVAPPNPNEGDNRPVAMRMETKQNTLPNGKVETITTTYITRPGGKEETVVQRSVGDSGDNPLVKNKSSSSAMVVAGSKNNGAIVPHKKKKNDVANAKAALDIKKKSPTKNTVSKPSKVKTSTALVPKETAVVVEKDGDGKRSGGLLGRLFGKKQ